MAPITILRTLIVVELVSALLGIYADIALQSTFPLELQAYLLTESQGPLGAYVVHNACCHLSRGNAISRPGGYVGPWSRALFDLVARWRGHTRSTVVFRTSR